MKNQQKNDQFVDEMHFGWKKCCWMNVKVVDKLLDG